MQSSEGRTEWRAPGWEKKSVGVGGALTEYDAKRVLASKALQTKPVAHETRAPTPAWSGLGFSNSLPDHVMREQLASTSSEDAGNQGKSYCVKIALTYHVKTKASVDLTSEYTLWLAFLDIQAKKTRAEKNASRIKKI